MPISRGAQVFLALGFFVVIGSASLIQVWADFRKGDRPRVLEIFDQPPTAANLHDFEKNLEDSSLVVNNLRPWMQFAQFEFLANAGDKVIVGRDGWFFYGQGVRA